MPTACPEETITSTSNAKVKKPRAVRAKRPQTATRVVIDVERSGDWMPVDDMMKTALSALEQEKELTLNLNNIDHLDASALQVLLALDMEEKNRGRHLQIVNASQRLRQWFEYSGTAAYFFETGATNNE
jgi:anti-anti-sigma factor